MGAIGMSAPLVDVSLSSLSLLSMSILSQMKDAMGGGLDKVLVETHGLGDGVAYAHIRLGRILPTHRLCHLAIRYWES